MSTTTELPLPSAEEFGVVTTRILEAIGTVIDGKPEVARTALRVLLAQGHLLLEDVPGVGKTLLAKTLARSVAASVNRIQFTPDLLPSDVTGVSIYNQDSHGFEFRRGPVFANLVIGDEINRASAKTQSALLECMEEHQVTVDGATYQLSAPFMVVATQNPIELEGTFPLPEAQRDRFMARVSMGYPDTEAELSMLRNHQSDSPLLRVSPVVDQATLLSLIDIVKAVHVADAVQEYIVALGQATRAHPDIRLGASPRALLQLLRASKAEAALNGRDFVLPDDVVANCLSVLGHRLVLHRKAEIAGTTVQDLVESLLAQVPVRTSARS
ncbi:AAA family ATPase [Arthrobacter rhombi]|uniref:AAA family ATPase n=1 Tax=Arthrobacter rhombi TaxID=71253 RepID=UPI003F907167